MKRIVGFVLFALVCVLAGCGLHRAWLGRSPASSLAGRKLSLPTSDVTAPAPAAQTVRLAAAEIGEAAESARRLAVEAGIAPRLEPDLRRIHGGVERIESAVADLRVTDASAYMLRLARIAMGLGFAMVVGGVVLALFATAKPGVMLALSGGALIACGYIAVRWLDLIMYSILALLGVALVGWLWHHRDSLPASIAEAIGQRRRRTGNAVAS